VRVLLAGGGTTGHIAPALATADALRRIDPQVAVTALGTARGLETRLVPAAGYPLELIPPVPLPRRLQAALLAVPARLAGAVRAAGRVLERTGADVVVGFGGYVALPAYLAALRRRVPIVVHEANARPGLANRLGARCTSHVAVSFAGTPLPHAIVTGLPIRRSVADLDRVAGRSSARAAFALSQDRPVLLVTGGSQGARSLNRAVAGAAPRLLDAGVQVLQAAGAHNVDDVRSALPEKRPGWVVLSYVDEMEQAYAAADLALCRAGANTVTEMAAVGLPAVYVPLPIGNGEQRRNAAPVVRAGGGLLVADADLSADAVADTVLALTADPRRLAAMSTAARRAGHPDADVALARMALAAARRG
jgi:UDP-N-acetylglucosamine--N-acetylmuramyl-(pentapeptide) pyrophosphoryl-undecaprenol N-acetylglucosamine transferase